MPEEHPDAEVDDAVDDELDRRVVRDAGPGHEPRAERAVVSLLQDLVVAHKVAGVVRAVRNHSDGPTLNATLARTGMLQLAFCICLSAGLLLSR